MRQGQLSVGRSFLLAPTPCRLEIRLRFTAAYLIKYLIPNNIMEGDRETGAPPDGPLTHAAAVSDSFSQLWTDVMVMLVSLFYFLRGWFVTFKVYSDLVWFIVNHSSPEQQAPLSTGCEQVDLTHELILLNEVTGCKIPHYDLCYIISHAGFWWLQNTVCTYHDVFEGILLHHIAQEWATW